MAVARTEVKKAQAKIQITEKDIFTNLFASFYQLAAQDRLKQVLGVLGETELYETYSELIPGINHREDFDAFLDEIPSLEELEKRLKQEIVGKFKGMDQTVNEIQTERAAALENPIINYQQYGAELLKDLSERFKIELNFGNINTEKEYQGYKQKLVKQIEKTMKKRLKKDKTNEIRLGDIVEATQLMEIDYDEGTFDPVYYHGGNETDIPLRSKGEVIGLGTGDRLEVLFEIDDVQNIPNVNQETEDGGQKKKNRKKGKRKRRREAKAAKEKTVEKIYKSWQMHPDEITATGENIFESMLAQYDGNAKKAAIELIAKAEESLMPKYKKEARRIIGITFDKKVEEATTALRREYNLNVDQIAAIERGDDFDYEIRGIGDIRKIDLPFQQLVTLAEHAFQYKAKVKPKGKKVTSQRGFVQYINQITEALTKFKPARIAIAKQQADVLANIIRTEYDIVKRRAQVDERYAKDNTGLLRATFKALLDSNFIPKLRRMFLYHDEDVYNSEPFSPPSEEMNRVIKVEVGNGCDYAKCTYCTAYGDTKFFVRSPEKFKAHVKEIKKKLGKDIAYIQRIFLAGGNIFMLPTRKLLDYLKIAKKTFDNQPYTIENYHYHGGKYNGRTNIRRIAAFGRTEGINRKTARELNQLDNAGLGMVYWGIETGADSILSYVNKGNTHEQMVEAGLKLGQTDIWTSVMIMPGLGGIKYYQDHVVETAKLLNRIQPRFITFLTTTPMPGSKYTEIMDQEIKAGTNRPLTDQEVVEQMYDMVHNLQTGYHCLVGAYLPPRERVGLNPISFTGRLQYNDGKSGILRILTNYFRDDVVPSQDLPTGKFNRNSRIRDLVR